MILSRPPSEVQIERDEILVELTNVTKNRIIIDDIRYHVDSVGRIRMDWTDMFFHAVDTNTKTIVPVFDVLIEIDSKYDFLKDYYSVSNLSSFACTLIFFSFSYVPFHLTCCRYYDFRVVEFIFFLPFNQL